MAQQAIGMIETKGLCSLFEAVDAGSKAASKVGELVASHVIARPHEDMAKAFLGETNATKK